MTKKPMLASEIVLRLTLDGRHQEAEALAHRVVELYKEDPTGDGTSIGSPEEGTCHDCGYVFTEADCQHAEIDPFILCDNCYSNRGGK